MKLYLDNCHIYITFPSPIGELHFSIFSLNSTKLFPQRFPSPIGELHFSMIMARGKKLSRIRVSVPYRGATFLNNEKVVKCRIKQRFRPLSGSYISQFENRNVIRSYYETVSVPYRGATFLNQARTFSDVAKNVSVPYRGATFLNNEKVVKCRIKQRFRPLSGSYISQ